MFSFPALVLLLAALPTPPASARTAPVRTLTVTARNYAYEMPDTVAAGRTEFRLLNKGTEMHHVSLIRLDGGRTVADFLAAVKAGGPPPAWAHDEGGPNTPVPGGTSVAIVDLTPGNYLTVCWIPSNDGVPHVMKGMIRGFTVVDPSRMKVVAKAAAPAAGALPDGAIKNVPVSDVTLTLNDYSFTFSKPLTAGKHMLRIENAAKQAHEIFIVRLAPGKSAKDVAAWVDKQNGPPPAEPLGGISSMSAGRVNEIPLDLAPGNYGLLCFIPDAKDGKPHVAHGMLQDIVVK